jgi:hypothetical protein
LLDSILKNSIAQPLRIFLQIKRNTKSNRTVYKIEEMSLLNGLEIGDGLGDENVNVMDNITNRFYENYSHNSFNVTWGLENKYLNANMNEFSTEVGLGVSNANETSDLLPKILTDSGSSLGWGDLALVSLFCSIIAGTVVSILIYFVIISSE